ncbi:hypothetical protein SAY87_006453 [Trapa incisa]|uniref:Uncharacterized protein n=1 Tax=Trapa incisa TaxID=236973 RepID=A0AAN7JYP1_9MYRT|nr:hypothetical protein SAY87_006453 [Trapa incisa]
METLKTKLMLYPLVSTAFGLGGTRSQSRMGTDSNTVDILTLNDTVISIPDCWCIVEHVVEVGRGHPHPQRVLVDSFLLLRSWPHAAKTLPLQQFAYCFL